MRQRQNHILKNEYLTVEISALGGEMQSIKNVDGIEYLWQGDPKFWSNRAINLFPYIGRLTDGKYKLSCSFYHMDIHGFVHSSLMTVKDVSLQNISFYLEDSPDVREIYPYFFEYQIDYKLEKNSIVICYTVINKDKKKMFFGLGGHPGFKVPLDENLNFSDYYLEFGYKNTPTVIGISEMCFVTGEDKPYELNEGKYIALEHTLFDHDAIILKDMDKEITLKTNRGNKSVSLFYPNMKYLGLWHMPHTDAPYICIEPWTSLPSRQGIVEDLEKQPDLISLEAGKVYENTWRITINQ